MDDVIPTEDLLGKDCEVGVSLPEPADSYSGAASSGRDATTSRGK